MKTTKGPNMDLGKIEPCRMLTHQPGTAAALPGSLWLATLYPKLIRLEGPQGQSIIYDLPIAGVVSAWSAQVDFLKREISIWGRANQYFHFRLAACADGIVLDSKEHSRVILVSDQQPVRPCQERLQFGAHDKVVIERWGTNPALQRLLQMWYALGASLDVVNDAHDESSLLGSLAQAVANRDRQSLKGLFLDTWRAGFSGMWAPRKLDASFWGYAQPATQGHEHLLLSSGSTLIRQLIVQNDADSLSLLPLLPKELPAGRLLNGQAEGYSFQLEWTKCSPRRVLIHSHRDLSLHLHWTQMQQARLRCLQSDKKTIARISPGEILTLKANQSILIDNFQKS